MEANQEGSSAISDDLRFPAEIRTTNIDDASFAVRIAPLSSFVTNLPDSFKCRHQSAEPRLKVAISPTQPDDVTVCIEHNMLSAHRLLFPENRGRVLKSTTVNQMHGMAYQLISRPLLMVVRVMYRKQRNAKWHLEVAHLVVLINTKHPSIQSQMEDGLKRGLRSLTKGRQFAVEFNFNPMITTWLKKVLYREHVLWTTSTNFQFFLRCEGASLVITNCSEYNCLFDVRAPDCCCLWMFCLPCCMVMCPTYTLTRCITVDDHRVTLKGDTSYWDLHSHEDAGEAVIHLREILCGESVDWNQVYAGMHTMCNEERLQARREGRSREVAGLSSYEAVISSQPQVGDDEDLPSYEEAVLLSGMRNDAFVGDNST